MALSLLVTGLEGEQPAQAAPVADPPPPATKVASRPDLVSAVVTARSQGAKVEVESMRTETATTWANPDGTMTTEAHMAPVRFKNVSGQWRSVNLELAKGTDGTVAPKGHQLGLRLGKRTTGTGGVFASAASASGGLMEWLAPFRLPEPSVDGTKATYAEVQPGVDLALDARRNGFEADFVVKSRPVSAPVWRFPLRTKGLTARTAKSGVIEFVDANNVVRSRIPVAYMWDAATNPVTGEPASKTIVNVSVEQVSAGKATLVVAPDAAWFMDPARVFPVTVDPTYVAATASPSYDTFVQTSVGTDLSSTTDLRVGKNGTHQERTFFNFGTGPFQGKDIVSATLSLYQDGATTCTPTAVNLYGAGVASTSTTSPTTWTNQPTISATASGTASFAKGFSSSCAAGRVGIPMTSLAQYWSTTQAGTVGVALKAASESDVSYWKRFRSMESSTDPFVSFTWNRKPNAPATVEPRDAVAYAAPGETTSSLYSASLRPYVQTKATDADANTVKYIFEFYTGSGPTLSVKGTCTSPVVASGSTAGCAPTTDLPDNTLLYIRAKANDGRLDGPWVGYNQRLRIGAATPATPVVSCPAPYANNSWQDTAPTANVTCTITATGTGYNAPGYLRVIIDGVRPPAIGGGPEGQVKITPSSDPTVARWTVIFPRDKAGLHVIRTQAETPAGTFSPSVNYQFGWGGSALVSPTADTKITTADTVRITASGPPKGTASSVTAKVKWRVSGYGGADDLIGWNDGAELPLTDGGAAGVTINTLWDTNLAETDKYLDANPDTTIVEPTQLNNRVPVKLDIQVCLKYGSTEQCSWSQTPNTTVQRLPHAFGNGFPVENVGPGQVALWTGEFNVAVTDVSVPGTTGDLSISRSHMTHESPGDSITGVFGEGWAAQFDGAGAGAAGLQVVDSTRLDGTLVLIDSDGASLIYEAPSGERRTDATFEVGDWAPVDSDTETDGSRLNVAGTGLGTVLSYIEDDGTITTWSPSADPKANAATLFRVTGVTEAGVAGKTTFSYDNAGRVARILAPPPAGVTCGAYVPSAHLDGLNAGCRALRFEYALIGSSRWRMSAAWLDTYNPDKTDGAGMDSVKVATYSYDANARLTKVIDPRSSLSTEYSYNSAGDLATVKPTGQIAYQLNYVTEGQRPKVDSVTRARPATDSAGGTATLAKYVYDVPLSGEGLPDLTGSSVGRWNQKSSPVHGFAVFGPDRPIVGTPVAADWQYADIQYTDAAGYTVNTAKFGAGDWQFTAADYNDQGNIIRALDERAVRTIIDDELPEGSTVDQLATVTVYNSEIKNAENGSVLTPAGTMVTDTYGPVRSAALKDGSLAWVRPHTRTSYDEGAPNAGIDPETELPYRLATRETLYSHDPGTNADMEVVSQTLTDYAALVPGDGDGWARNLPSRSITDVDLDGTNSSGDIVTGTRYDAEGRVIETRQPASNGADAGTTKTVYYTQAPNGQFAGCGSKPEWAGLVCKVYPAAQPSSASGVTPTLPTTTKSEFTYLLAPRSVSETSGTATRTTTLTYLLDGRASSVATVATGVAASTRNTRKVTSYDPATGQPLTVTAKNEDNSTASSITTGYDSWGRQTTYQPSGEQPTTITYGSSGSVAVVTDATGSTSYAYDGIDARGRQERRGLPTKVEVITADTTWISTAGYDSAGLMAVQKLPGGTTRYNDIDAAGAPVGLRYTGQVTTTDPDSGVATVDPDGPWLSWSLENDVTGRIAHEWTPDGAGFTSPAGGAIPYDRRYSYDNAGRLVQVNDRTANSSGVDIDDPAEAPGCRTRTYSFDRNDNRLLKSASPASADGSCSVIESTSISRSFDTADRPISGANGVGNYIYDALGRNTGLPAADAPNSSDGDVVLGYYDNDLVRSIKQGAATTTFALDAMDRRSSETIEDAQGSTQMTHHYTDASDNPTWSSNGSTIERYVNFFGTGLSAMVRSASPSLVLLTNPHGDVVSAVELLASSETIALSHWTNYEEYGARLPASNAGGSAKYGWSGQHQRASSGSGLVMMGRRVYNPASGIFSSVDPVAGGTANRYTFPTDPVNMFDLDGCKCKFRGIRVTKLFWQHWESKWIRIWYLNIWIAMRTKGLLEGIEIQHRIVYIAEAKCSYGQRLHRWAFRYQTRHKYIIGNSIVPWLSYDYITRWVYARGWGAYAWTSGWYD